VAKSAKFSLDFSPHWLLGTFRNGTTRKFSSSSSPSSSRLFLKGTIQQKQCIDNSGQDKSGNEALTTAVANRHGIINNTNAESNNTELYIKANNTRQNYREYRRRQREKIDTVYTALKCIYGAKINTSAGKLFHALITRVHRGN